MTLSLPQGMQINAPIRPGFDTSALIINAVIRYQWN